MKKVLMLILGLLVAGIAVFVFANRTDSSSNVPLTEADIGEKFMCDRVTADTRATDIYCQNPEYYYQDAETGTVIDDTDFDDPRYKAIYE